MIKDQLTRLQLYNSLYQMMEDGQISGLQLYDIFLNNLKHEINENVIKEMVQINLPTTISNRIPVDLYFEKVSLTPLL